ncbi:uncharacterized protein LOC112688974 [Sipha flava]|uniref:Uncharacterized protein LOC112688974 n=1 Tax=Sipha flava TaxID=143950 RepID=A0A8B8G4R6_9HEMI|nr:uncharacterized protein LOC112688974 [Sipha flava]
MSHYIFSCSKSKNSNFGVPKDADIFKTWQKSLGMPLKRSSRVCEIHFEPQDIVTEWMLGLGLSILIFDEISLRESLSVNSKTLTYTGLEDFGGDIQRKEGNEHKANHGFVFMWQSLTEKFTQSIAVFASNGPIKSVHLT